MCDSSGNGRAVPVGVHGGLDVGNSMGSVYSVRQIQNANEMLSVAAVLKPTALTMSKAPGVLIALAELCFIWWCQVCRVY